MANTQNTFKPSVGISTSSKKNQFLETFIIKQHDLM